MSLEVTVRFLKRVSHESFAYYNLHHRDPFFLAVLTRRRDILYGSFRAAMNSSFGPGSGTGFKMSAMYNGSETIDVGLFMADLSNESTLQWSFSARSTDADPVKFPISTLLGASDDGFLEHRFDWTPSSILYGNNNTNLTASSLLVPKDDSHTIPSMPVPISFRHWSNGDPTASDGPPHDITQVGRVKYARFFFNSSLASREQEFTSQCAAAGNTAMCSTEDISLRGSTAFDQVSTFAVPPITEEEKAPLYSLIGITAAGGLIAILLIHGLVKNFILKKSSMTAVPTNEAVDDPNTPIEGMNQIPMRQQTFSSTTTTTSDKFDKEKDDDGDNSDDMERNSIDRNLPRTLSSSVLAKWDPATLAKAQLQDDSDDSDDDGDSDDDDLMQDAQQETDITNDDGLGRPDRFQFMGHPHSVPTPESLPQFNSLLHSRRSSTHMSGYMTPARTSQPSLLLQQGANNEEEDQTGPSRPPTAWNNSWSASTSRRGSGMNIAAAAAATPFGGGAQVGPTSRLNSIAPLAELHQKLLAGADEDFVEKGEGSGSDSCSDNSRPLTSHTFFRDYSMDSSLHHHHHDSIGRKNSTDSWLKSGGGGGGGGEDFYRRPSVASFNSLSLLTKSASPNLNEEFPIISVWTRNKETENTDQGDTLAARVDDPNPKPIRTKPWYKKAFEYMFVNEGGGTLTASGAARVSYLEGLRGFACFLVSFNHFMLMFWYAATTAGAPTHTNGFEVWFYRILSPILLNQGTKIGIFFVLPARVMGTRYMLRGKLQDVADSTLRRVPRLAFPTFGAVLINYFLIQVNAYKWVPRLASRTWSTWAYFEDYDSAGSFINAWIGLWFTLPPDSPVLLSTYATGVLWTIPVITQSSFAILITVIISKEVPNAYKRYGFYFICMFLSWYANRLDYYFIAGLVIADMDNKLKYREAAARGIPLVPQFIGAHLPKWMKQGRVHGQIIGWFLFLGGSMIQYLEFNRAPGRHFNTWEHGILPDLRTSLPRVWEGPVTETYNDPRFSLFAMVMGIFLLCDLCQGFAGFFMLRWWGAIGRNAFSLYLLHGTIFWTWGAWLSMQLLVAGCPYWAAMTIVFLTSYFLLAIWCEVFTRTFDAWGVSMSKAMWRYSSGGLGRRD